jgi:hypothetical protein
MDEADAVFKASEREELRGLSCEALPSVQRTLRAVYRSAAGTSC